jgi:hypothetical protein
LEAQRQRLKAESLLVGLEQAAARLDGYRTQVFSEVWFQSADVADSVVKVGQARQLFEGVKARLATASSAIAVADNDLGLIERIVRANQVVLDSFVAVLMGRKHIWAESGRAPGGIFNPSVRESQQGLHASGSRLADAVREHINELAVIQGRHKDVWPKNLDLANLQAHLDDARKALKIYEEQFASRGEALPPESSITLLLIAQKMEQGVDMIESERANLAVAIATRAALKNNGRR